MTFELLINLEKIVGPIFGHLSQNLALFWLFSGLDLAPWHKVDLATLF